MGVCSTAADGNDTGDQSYEGRRGRQDGVAPMSDTKPHCRPCTVTPAAYLYRSGPGPLASMNHGVHQEAPMSHQPCPKMAPQA